MNPDHRDHIELVLKKGVDFILLRRDKCTFRFDVCLVYDRSVARFLADRDRMLVKALNDSKCKLSVSGDMRTLSFNSHESFVVLWRSKKKDSQIV